MITFDWLIIAFFKITNSCLIIGIATYLFKKHLLPVVRKEMHEEEDALQSLKKRNRSLAKQEKGLEGAIRDDAHECERLKEKVLTWRKQVEQEYAKREQEKEDRIKHITLMMEPRIEYVMRQKAYQEIMPTIFDEVRKTLGHEWTEAKAQELGNKLLAVIQKSVQ